MKLFIPSLILLSIFTWAFVDLNLSYLSFLYTGLYLHQRLLLSLIYFILISALFGGFYFIINRRLELKEKVTKAIILIIVIGILVYPGALSFDIFNYITTAKVTYFYHENPYLIYPIEFTSDPYLAFTRATNKTALYGPVWLLLSGIPFFIGLGNFLVTLFSFKLFISIFFSGTIYIIYKLDKNAIPFFALNPLVLIETLFSGHNDVVMVFFTLVSIYLITTKKFISVLFFFLSILIKFATVFLIPVYVLTLFGRIEREKLYKLGAISMFFIFLLSPLREELYPWYAIWFISFTCFLHKNRMLQNLVLFFSFGMMLRYIPYMATGNYFGSTPIIRIILMLTPVAAYLVFSAFKNRFKFN